MSVFQSMPPNIATAIRSVNSNGNLVPVYNRRYMTTLGERLEAVLFLRCRNGLPLHIRRSIRPARA